MLYIKLVHITVFLQVSSYLNREVKIFDKKKSNVMVLVKVVHSFSIFFAILNQKHQKDLAPTIL